MEKKRKLSVQRYKQMSYNNWNERTGIILRASEAVEKLFNKYYKIKNENFKLPAPERMFAGCNWQINKLQQIKKDLNETKSQLNDFPLMEWKQHTRKRNQAGHVLWRLRRDIEPEFLTQAWLKFYENLSSFPLIPGECFAKKELNSVHLCEAPGAFVTSLNHYLVLNAPEVSWRWLATTHNPHYEGNSLSTMINDDRIILHSRDNWLFGADNTGNIMNLENLDELIDKAKENGSVLLVTADGSINCFDAPDEQESTVVHLHLCETVAALHILSYNGSFLLKIFTVFEDQTVCLMYLLNCCFGEVIMNKPATSREGNSEVYVVCLGFRGQEAVAPYLKILRRYYEESPNVPMFDIADIPGEFVRQICQAGEFFKTHQCEVIVNNINAFKCRHDDRDIKMIRKVVADHFIAHCRLEPIAEAHEIIGKHKLSILHDELMEPKFLKESYNDRKRKEDQTPLEKLKMIKERMERIISDKDCCRFHFDYHPTLVDIEGIVLGKPYERIQSSRFCAAEIMTNFNAAFDIQNECQLNIQLPEAAAKMRFIEKMKMEGKRVCCFEFSLRMNATLIEDIHEIARNLREEETIVLLGYCLLTQLHVGLLYILAHTFETIEFQLFDNLGCVITLNNFKSVKRVVEIIGEIFQVSKNAKKKNKAVISICPMLKLCDSPLYEHVLKMNHGTIKNFMGLIGRKMEKLQF